MGKMILLIAATQQGKTTKCKAIIKDKPCLVFDVNGEYDDLSDDANDDRCRYFSENVKDFLNIVPHKHGGTVCVFEEATGFFAGATQKDTKKIIVGKRHPVARGGRNLIFVFHSIQSVPPFLLSTADVIILGKTGDEYRQVKAKASKLLAPFVRLQKSPQYSFLNIKNI